MTSSAGDVRAAVSRLREAGARLRRRPAAETLAALARVLDAWRDPASRWRRALERELPGAAGFTSPVVREGMALALAGWKGEALLALVDRELGGPRALDGGDGTLASPFDVTATLLAGALPSPSLLALLAPLAVRSAVLARPSSHDPVTARLVAESITAEDAGLGACLEIVSFPRGDDDALGVFLSGDCVVATGSDATVRAIAARVQPPQRLVTYGHRVSVGLVGPEATHGEALGAAARGLALDVSLWDQLGCLSPVSVLVVGDARAAVGVADALAVALRDLAPRLPRGRVDPAAAAVLAQERAAAEMRAAAGREVFVRGGRDEPFCVVCEDDATLRPAPLHRFVRVHPVGPDGIGDALAPLASHLAGVAVAGFGAGERRLLRLLADLGASRLCRPGRLQGPPLGWHHDGQGVLLPLVRSTDLELD